VATPFTGQYIREAMPELERAADRIIRWEKWYIKMVKRCEG
jgi:hypothetical protein